MANADEAAIRQAMAKSMPSVKIDSVKPSEIKGLYEVTVGANIFYVSEDGNICYRDVWLMWQPQGFNGRKIEWYKKTGY